MKIFLSYSSVDDAAARALKAALEKHDSKLDIFFAPEKFRAGQFWLPGLADEIAKSKACVVLIGEKGPGRWQLIEYYAAYDRSVKDRSYKTVPVVLGKSAPGFPFIEQLHWIAAEAAGDRAAALVLDTIKGKSKDKPAPWKIVNPFRDLEAFDEAQADLYFGRDEEIDGAVKALAGNAKDVTILIGNSGVGKSSLVKAGIFAALRRRKFARSVEAWPLALEASRQWLYLTLKPGEQPLDALASAFMDQWELDPTSATDKLKRTEWVAALTAGKLGVKDLVDASFARLKDLGRPVPEAVFLYVDQGEELYANPLETARRFSEALTKDLDGKRLRVLMSMRSDHYHKLQADAPLFSRSARIDVPPLAPKDFEEIMTKAAAALGAKFAAADLPQRIARSAADQPGALALLSVYLADMWRAMQERGDGVLSLAQAENTIDIGAALEKRASRYYNDRPERQKPIQHLFVPRLVRVPKDGPPLRRRVRLKDLEDDAQRQIVTDLAGHDMRLLVTSVDQDKEPTAEVAHEVLFRAWPLLAGWIGGQRGFLEWKEEAEQARKTWEGKGRRRGDLLMGGALERAKEKCRDFSSDLETADKSFIEKSAGWARQKLVAGALVLAIVFVSLVGGLYLLDGLRQQAVDARIATEAALLEAKRRESLFLAPMSRNALKEKDIDKALAIALEALPDQRGNARPIVNSALQALSTAYWTANWIVPLRGHIGPVRSAAFSPDGSRVVTASTDKTARLWDGKTGAFITALEGHEGAVSSAAFSPDGSRVVTASEDKTARLWDGKTGTFIVALEGHGDIVWSAAFSPDGSRVVTASEDKTARLWDGKTGAFITALEGHGGRVWSAAFSPDGSRVVTASTDKTARLWDGKTGAFITALEGHEGAVSSAAFSPDGSRVVTASVDKTARLWDGKTGALIIALEGHGGIVNSAAFSPDGSRVVTASWDKTARLWDGKTGALIIALEGHGDRVLFAAFSPDGSRVVTASEDKTARLWDGKTGAFIVALEGHGDIVWSAAFSPDGSRVVTASWDKTARLWDGKTGTFIVALEGHEGAVSSAAFSPDGSRVVTASREKTARLWDGKTGAFIIALEGHWDTVYSAAFSPDGSRVVTASWDKTARLWDGKTGALIIALEGHGDRVWSAAFSPDGSRVVTASEDKTARLWDGKTGAFIVALEGHGDIVWSAAFSPDGSRVVTASWDKTARLWDGKTGALIIALEGHGDRVWSAAFSPDGSRVVTASWDKTARLWDGKTGAFITALEGHGSAVYSAAFSPDGSRVVTASKDMTARIWPVPFATVQEFITAAHARQARCLTAEKRKELFLEPIPDIESLPLYCVE